MIYVTFFFQSSFIPFLMVGLTSFPGGKVSKKDAFSVTSQMGTQRAGKVKFLCTAFKKVMLELEGIFFF